MIGRYSKAWLENFELRIERNQLVHSYVYSDPGGRQQLIYQAQPLRSEGFFAASISLPGDQTIPGAR